MKRKVFFFLLTTRFICGLDQGDTMFSWPLLESVSQPYWERVYISWSFWSTMIAGAQRLFPSRFGGEKVYFYYDNGERVCICTLTSFSRTYKAITNGTTEVVWVETTPKKLHIFQPRVPVLWCDNLQPVRLVVNDSKFLVRTVFFSHTKLASSNNPRSYTIVLAPAEQATCCHISEF